MNFITDLGKEYNIREYILQTIQSVQRLRELYPNLMFHQLAQGIIHVEVPEGADNEFELLQSQSNVLTIPQIYALNAAEALSDANILAFHEYPFGALRGEGIIIGFIDTGIDYTNKLFKNADNTTRILRIWDQTISGSPPRDYTFGTEYTKEEIDRALQSENPYEVVPTRDEIGHGTYLAGVAAGDDKTGKNEYVGGAPDASIMMVKLKEASVNIKRYYLIRDTDIAYQSNDIIAGINYLLEAALEFQRPLVICIAIGNNYGAHTGTAILERYLDSLTVIPNLIITVATGNEANSGHHFRGVIKEGERQDIEINVSQEELRGFWVYGWANIADILAVSVRSPIGQVVQKVPVSANEIKVFTFSLEKTIITVIYNYPNSETGVANISIRFQLPTPGLWTVTVHGEKVVDGTYDFWLQRTGFVIENTRFLQPDTLVTLSIPSTAEFVITVGAYNYVDQSIYVGSGRGPMANNGVKPDLIAPGVNVSGPALGGGYTTYDGTSTAAAITASAAVLLMQWAVLNNNLRTMNTRMARDILIRGARRSPGIEYPNPIEGFGKLDLRNAIASI